MTTKKNKPAKKTAVLKKKSSIPGISPHTFPVVCLGASAGGLKALEDFFRNMPEDPGMAFVVVTHMLHKHKSHLRDLLARYTTMEVSEATHGQHVAPNHVYVIPEGKKLSIKNKTLRLHEPDPDNPVWHPIDFFLRSLAQDLGRGGIAVILSGTGNDGTLGLKEIKAEGGVVLAQSTSSAQYDGMQDSAVGTGLVDAVLPPEEMPAALINFNDKTEGGMVDVRMTPDEANGHLDKILGLLLLRMGHDLSWYKKSTILRRITKRMLLKGMDSLQEYYTALEDDRAELAGLFGDLLIGVTSFFRDPEAFRILRHKVVPDVFAGKNLKSPLRVWVAGCSTGEEAYSVAIVLREHMERLKRACDIQIFATDISRVAIDKARAGVYPSSIAGDMDPQFYERYFEESNGQCVISKTIREMVVFAPHDLLRDPPFFKIDLICCRNLLIYLDPDVQENVLKIFLHALNTDGMLFLGQSESVGQLGDWFSIVDTKWKLFRKKEHPPRPLCNIPLPSRRFRPEHEVAATHRPERRLEPAGILELNLLKKYGHPAVLIDEQMEVLHFFGNTQQFIGPPEGKPTSNLVKILKRGLRLKIKAAIQEAVKARQAVTVRDIRLPGADGRSLNVIIEPLKEPPQAAGLLLVVFELSGKASRVARQAQAVDFTQDDMVVQLEQELKSTSDQLQCTIEELELSNEELTSMNEELQASNEELETSREELQALNEELTAVNTELNHKVDELQDAYNDIDNLLVSTNMATIFVDRDLVIRRFTPTASNIFHLLKQDVGRPLGHIVSTIEYPGLLRDCRETLQQAVWQEKEVFASDGRCYMARLFPYRTQDDVIEGVVVTFVDVSELKRVQTELQAHKDRLEEKVAARTRDIAERESLLSATLRNYPGGRITVLDEGFTVLFADGLGYRDIDLDPATMVGRKLSEFLTAEEFDAVRPFYERAFAGKTVETEAVRNGRVSFLTASPLRRNREHTEAIIVVARDVTEQKKREEQILKLSLFPEQNPHPVLRLDALAEVLYANNAGKRLFGLTEELEGSRLPDTLTRAAVRCFESGVLCSEEIEVEGQTYLFSIAPIPEFDYVNCYGLNITPRKEAMHELQKELSVTAALSRLYNSLISPASTIDDIARSVYREALHVTGSEQGYAALLDPMSGELLGHTLGDLAGETLCKITEGAGFLFAPVRAGQYPGLWGHALNTKTPFYTNDPAAHVSAGGVPEGHFPIRNLLNMPVLLGEELVGQIVTANKEQGFDDWDIQAVGRLAEHYALAIQRIRSEGVVKEQERLRALGEMASGIVHDINNALSPIMGYAELLLHNNEQLDARELAFLEHIKTAADDIAHITSNMREFYRKRDPETYLQPVDVNALISQVVELTRPRWKDMPQEKGVTIKVVADLQKGLPNIPGNASELREALTNLIFNAVDAMPSGGTITIRSKGMDDMALVEVSDTGQGMPERVQQRCLEPLYTTKEGGTGMGLAQVYGIVQRHGGDIEINSKPQWGTTIRLILPMQEGMSISSQDSREPQCQTTPLHILCVDDEPALRRLLEDLLSRDGHTVMLAEDGRQGLVAFREALKGDTPFDLVITDLGMPDMDGREVARQIKKESPKTPLVLLSGWAQFLSLEEEREQYFTSILNKPPTLSVLRRVLSSIFCSAD